jgi:LuxR family maltose regulon positive regulatory protein
MIIHQAARQVRLRLALDDVETALQWAKGDPRTFKRDITDSLPTYLREVQQVSLARVYLAQDEYDRVLAIFDRMRAQAQAAGRKAHVIELCLIKALALQAQGHTDAAIEALEQSLSLAAPEGYVRLFLEEGEPLATLLRQVAARGNAPDYANRLLEAFDVLEPRRARPTLPHPTRRPSSAESVTLVEPLTRRELHVLQLIHEGYSNQEIAEELVLALNTIKRHTSNIYSKLGVNSRTQALAQARQLGLLPSDA